MIIPHLNTPLVVCWNHILLLNKGALKQGPCTCSTFKAFNLMYLHVLLASPFFMVINARTNVPLSSAQLPTSFQHPLKYCFYNYKCIVWHVLKKYLFNNDYSSKTPILAVRRERGGVNFGSK